jgi:hypothetical protein
MPDLTSISAILTSVKAATDIATLLNDADLSLEKAELRLKLADLISALADARIEIAGVQETLNLKDSEIRKLQEALRIKSNLKYEEPAYWLMEGDKREGPYCQQCYDKEGKLIRLQGGTTGVYDCKTCNNTFTTRQFREEQEASVRRANRDWNPV